MSIMIIVAIGFTILGFGGYLFFRPSKNEVTNTGFGLLFLGAGAFVFSVLGYGIGAKHIALDSGALNELSVCKVYETVGVVPDGDRFIVPIREHNTNQEPVVYWFNEVPPKVFVKTKDGKYVSFPDPGTMFLSNNCSKYRVAKDKVLYKN